MKKFLISFLLALSLCFSSCESIKVNGIEVGKEVHIETQIDSNDILPWVILISTCSIMYIGVPCIVMGNLVQN